MLILKGIKEEVRVPVIARVVDNGKEQRIPFTAIFKRKPFSENKRILSDLSDRATTQDRINSGELDEDTELPGLSDEELLQEYLCGWDLKNKDGDAIAFDGETLEQVLEFTEYRSALITGLMDALLGRGPKAKN